MAKTLFFKIGEYKVVEIKACILSRTRTYFNISTMWSKNIDYAGFYFYLFLFKFSFKLNICDIRRWDNILNRWEPLPICKVDEEDEWEDQIGI